jgi:hypothetical protein
MHDLTSTREPVGLYQAGHHVDLTMLLGYYHARTPGVWLVSRVTIELPTGDRIQPHLAMLIAGGPRKRHQAEPPDGRLRGSPDLAVDVEWAIDEAEERRRADVLAAGGVGEYLLMHIQSWSIHWYRTEDGRPRLIAPDDRGIIKSSVLPGLWVSAWAILGGEGRDRDWKAPIDQGVQSPEHADLMRDIRGPEKGS